MNDSPDAPGLSENHSGLAPELSGQRRSELALPGPLRLPLMPDLRPPLLLLIAAGGLSDPLADFFTIAGFAVKVGAPAQADPLARALRPNLLIIGLLHGREAAQGCIQRLRRSADRELTLLPLLALLPDPEGLAVEAAFRAGADDVALLGESPDATLLRASGMIEGLKRPAPLHGLTNPHPVVRRCVARLLVESRAKGLDDGLRALRYAPDTEVRELAAAILAMRKG